LNPRGNFQQGNPSKEMAGKNARRVRFFAAQPKTLPKTTSSLRAKAAPTAFITNNTSVNRLNLKKGNRMSSA
jgi:hypothetical protein